MYDVIIVGAGPSGSFSAIKLASAGLQVMIIEKQKFPRVKLCGGGISPKASKMVLKYIDLEKHGAKKISGLYMSNQNKTLLHIPQPSPAYSIERSKFDDILLQKAIELGAEVKMPAMVKKVVEEKNSTKVILDDNSVISSKYLILAEGINGKLNGQLGYCGSKEITMALEMNVYPRIELENINNNLFFDTGSIPNGYAWMFPKNGYINTGAYFYNSSSISTEQRQSFYDFLNLFDWMKDTKLGKLKGYPIPRNIKYNHYNTQLSLIVGDACGAAENFFGEGIYLGLLSARFASEAIKQAINLNTKLDQYTKIVRDRISKRVKYSRIMAHIFYRHHSFCFKYLVMNSKMNKIYHQYVQGALSSRKVMYFTFLLLPYSRLSKVLKEENPSTLGFTSSGT